MKKEALHIICKVCCTALEDSPSDPLDPITARFIMLKNNGKLKTPSRSTFEVVEKAEDILKFHVASKSIGYCFTILQGTLLVLL